MYQPKEWVAALKAGGFKAHAITDHGSLAGAVPFYHLMKGEGLTPIIGCEFYYNNTPQPEFKMRKNAHIILLAKNYDGYQNLLRLSELSFSEGFYFRPRIGMEWIAKYSENLICLTACLGGVLSVECWREQDGQPTTGLEKRHAELKAIFGDDLYVEYQLHAAKDQQYINNEFLTRLPKAKHVVTNDCHYISAEQHIVQDTLKKAVYGNSEASDSYTTFDSLWLKKPRDIWEARRFHEYLPDRFVVDGMKATEEIVEKCSHFEMPSKRYLPSFPKSQSLFSKLTKTALQKFLTGPLTYGTRREYIERFKKEYKTIAKYNLEDYFMIIWDVLRFAREKGIYYGIGRGSSAGSFICYLLGIVKIDPIQYKLIFERFLNDIRCVDGELPDVDLDFESARRDEIKDYVTEKYGAEHVCGIGSYSRYKVKSILIDFGKQFGLKHHDLLQITTKLQAESVEDAKQESEALNEICQSIPELERSLVEASGQIKTQSIHPAGLIICDEPLSSVIPLKTQKVGKGKDEKRIVVTQTEDKHLVSNGFVKMDFLGIDEYDLFKYVIENSKTKLNADNYIDEIHHRELSHSDDKVWDLFRVGQTQGVFQFGSSGMQELLRAMDASCLDDIIAAVALYRPGCLSNGWHIRYCRRKHGEEKVDYIHPDVEEILKDTYGIPVFQEQVIFCFHTIGGISLTDSDILRSALGKKDKAKLAAFKEKFVKGATVKLGSEIKAVEFWDELEKSSGYSFNRAHSGVYGLLAYISQYFKVHHTEHFWAGTMTRRASKNKTDQVVASKVAAEQMGVLVLPPDVNKSDVTFSVEADTGKIRWGLIGIKGVGDKAAEEIIAARPFKDFSDFHDRVNKSKVRFDIIMKLIYAGAFDSLADRVECIEKLYKLKKRKDDLPDTENSEMLLAFYRSVGYFEDQLSTFYGFSSGVLTEFELCDLVDGDPALIAGVITELVTIRTKKGDTMAKAVVSDKDQIVDAILFPKSWSRFSTKLSVGTIVEIQGSKSSFSGKENQIHVDEVKIF
jgi:DNA polymerase-3 subunit alpha